MSATRHLVFGKPLNKNHKLLMIHVKPGDLSPGFCVLAPGDLHLPGDME
jgi:hypothetical protein